METVSAPFWAMVILQTIGSVDTPGKGERKMPAPRSYVAIIVLFGTLGLFADAGYERAANVMAWVTVLVGVVIGPFGKTLSNFYNSIANQFAIPPPGPNAPTAQQLQQQLTNLRRRRASS